MECSSCWSIFPTIDQDLVRGCCDAAADAALVVMLLLFLP